MVWYEGLTLTSQRYLVTDERGSVIAGTDGAGATLFKNVYDEYGRPGSANQGRFQYTGQMWLAEAGLYHYKARLYDPGLGRFLQTDPIGYADGLNLYAYVGGDPINATDPSGLEVADEIFVHGIRRDYNLFLENLRAIALDGFFRDVGSLSGLGSQNEGAEGGQDTDQECSANPQSNPTDFSLVNVVAGELGAFGQGVGDIFTFGLYSRAFAALPGPLGESYSAQRQLGGYDFGTNTATAASGFRLFYAAYARSISVFASSGRSAVEARNQLKGTLSGLGFSHPRIYSYDQLLTKYRSDAAVRAAAGRTDPSLNSIAGVGAAGAAASDANQQCPI